MSDPAPAADQTADKSFLSALVSGKTPGVKNIEAAYRRAGATKQHTPGAAGTLGGSGEEMKSGARAGQGGKVEEGISVRRQEPSVIGKVVSNLINGTEGTK